MKNCLIILFALCMGVGAYAKDNKKKYIVANPIDVEYAFTRQEKAGGREAADPMIVLFKDKYYLFATWNFGYWVSDDLCNWTFITSDVLPFQYFAPAVMVYKDELYWMGSLNNSLYKTSNPEDGHSWTVASDAICAFRDNPEKTVVDPYLFVDDDQRVYLYWGSSMEEPLRAVELDTEHGFRPKADPTVVIEHNEHIYGWECRGSRNELAQPSCSEGSAMLKYNGRYYLQYAAPGTQFDTYGDGLYTSNNPLGPFVHEPSSPFSVKPGGWMTGAGHGNTFQDKYGNWWHVATTVISQRYKFERRIGLWPVVFTPEGRPYTLTDYSDMPYIIPDRKIDWFKESPWTGWMDLSIGKKVSVSSATADHPAHHASDFTIKTWWSAATGEVGEWLSMDLGQKCCVNAIQANFADEGFGMFEEGAPKTPYRFSLDKSLLTEKLFTNFEFKPNLNISIPTSPRGIQFSKAIEQQPFADKNMTIGQPTPMDRFFEPIHSPIGAMGPPYMMFPPSTSNVYKVDFGYENNFMRKNNNMSIPYTPH